MKAKPGKTTKPSQPLGKPKPAPSKVASKTGAAKPSPAKSTAKTAAKPSPAKTAAKPSPAKSAAKVATKPAAKAVSKTAPKATAQSESSKVRMPSVSTNKSPPPAKAAPVKPAGPVKAHASAAAQSAPAPARAQPEAVAPVAAAPVSGALTQRPGRPSSRLASLTVPSMAQSVASTAAKASYMQLAAAPLIIPPLPSAAKKDPKLANNWKTKPVEQLTDAELLAMPDSEYMNDKQLAAFRLKLSLLKQDILNSAGETTEHLREDTVVVPDPADRATIEEEHALELRTRDRERKLLKKIEQSIARIDAGDYGYCDETGEPIGVGRLLARPTATLSLEAQQRRELKQKMFGD